MPLIASLPWYPFDEIMGQYNIFWSLLRDALLEKNIDAPDKLSLPNNFRIHWASRDLLLSQCCGYHIATKAQKLEVVGAPDFMLDNLSPGEYRSIVITRKSQKGNALEDFQGCRAAFNEDQSFSGHTALLCTLPLNLLRPGFFSNMVPTGSHYDSMQAVVDGKADVAAIDEISFRIITNERSDLRKKLRIITHTQNAQAPPYVTSSHRPAEEINVIRDTLVSVSRTEAAKSALQSMYIRSIIDATNEDYLPLAKEIKKVEDATGI